MLRTHVIGERLGAAMSILVASPHVSKRGVEEVVETAFGVPVSLGTAANMEQEMSQALATPHAQARQAVQQARVKHVDETSWKQARQKLWLWAAATARVACFVIYAGRNRPRTGRSAGRAHYGDRVQRSLWGLWLLGRCLSTSVLGAQRDFQKVVDRRGGSQPLREAGLVIVSLVFHWWHAYRGGIINRKTLQREVEPIRQSLQLRLEQGCACADARTPASCQNLLHIESAIWTVLYTRGVEPTNNHAERLLRSGVLWRRISFGCRSAAGCRFVECILTVTQTLRLQKRPVLDYLNQVLLAHRGRLPAPNLLTGG